MRFFSWHSGIFSKSVGVAGVICWQLMQPATPTDLEKIKLEKKGGIPNHEDG